MGTASLRMFVAKVIGKRRLGFGDLRRLQREILPKGIRSRSEAEVLLALNDTVPRLDRAWTDYLVRSVTEFVVWYEEPAGSLADDTAEWLLDVLACKGSSKVALAIARGVGREAGGIAEVSAEEDAAAPGQDVVLRRHPAQAGTFPRLTANCSAP